MLTRLRLDSAAGQRRSESRVLRRANSRSLFEKGLLMWLFAQVPCSSVGFPEQLHRKLHPHSSLASSVVYLPKVSRLISHVGVLNKIPRNISLIIFQSFSLSGHGCLTF